MRVLWLAPLPYINNNSGHPAAWVITLALALVKKGIDLTIINYNHKIKNNVETITYKGIKIIYIEAPSGKIDLLSLYTKRINILKKYLIKNEQNYDLLHIHGTEHQYEVMANELNIPKVISIQGIINEYIKILPIINIKQYAFWKIAKYYENKYMKNYNYYSCRTHWDTNYIKNNIPNAKIFTIWEMIREPFFNTKIIHGNKNILFVGGKNPIKGLKELLIAYNNSIQNLGCGLVILGNCKKEDILRIIKKYNLINIDISNINIRGMQDAIGMIKAYSECFCLVHPTYIDNSPNSICEAQLAGLPVIATDVGGVSTLIKNGETGILVDKNTESIEISVKKLLTDKKFWDKISENSYELGHKRHNPQTIIEQTINMYNFMLKENKHVYK